MPPDTFYLFTSKRYNSILRSVYFCNKFPGFATILGELKIPVIRTNPDYTFLYRAGSNADNRCEVFSPGDIIRQTTAFKLLLFGCVIRGKIGRNDRPGIPMVGTFMQKLATETVLKQAEMLAGELTKG